jgi:hypothetical protein
MTKEERLRNMYVSNVSNRVVNHILDEIQPTERFQRGLGQSVQRKRTLFKYISELRPGLTGHMVFTDNYFLEGCKLMDENCQYHRLNRKERNLLLVCMMEKSVQYAEMAWFDYISGGHLDEADHQRIINDIGDTYQEVKGNRRKKWIYKKSRYVFA